MTVFRLIADHRGGALRAPGRRAWRPSLYPGAQARLAAVEHRPTWAFALCAVSPPGHGRSAALRVCSVFAPLAKAHVGRCSMNTVRPWAVRCSCSPKPSPAAWAKARESVLLAYAARDERAKGCALSLSNSPKSAVGRATRANSAFAEDGEPEGAFRPLRSSPPPRESNLGRSQNSGAELRQRLTAVTAAAPRRGGERSATSRLHTSTHRSCARYAGALRLVAPSAPLQEGVPPPCKPFPPGAGAESTTKKRPGFPGRFSRSLGGHRRARLYRTRTVPRPALWSKYARTRP